MEYAEIIRRVVSGPRTMFYRLADGENNPGTRIWKVTLPLGPRQEAESLDRERDAVIRQAELETDPRDKDKS